ncbi:hypothetical protein Shyd_58230 [Streptomyces hydrogenans]|uniref:EAL domain-containing protein n=1 Tax=Streptomyces hydrogenans TaxID=1873719 RepID=A0ABQ3PHG4_9ACTN|nr:hypothetical protein Shyd_58230 [Streptomyces hydrogenans]
MLAKEVFELFVEQGALGVGFEDVGSWPKVSFTGSASLFRTGPLQRGRFERRDPDAWRHGGLAYRVERGLGGPAAEQGRWSAVRRLRSTPRSSDRRRRSIASEYQAQ